ncbi:hypothetical protein K435DRAFT_864369 [Dendrothele bispora CBS 962.96]|uniref:Uncharacterized protein n=1 Tax=Dendrothele bispora (strain CBS 962.96) TaxID=1314807 RepID=A0A4S8LMM0_DENBC|nr:hypothetical protein K435DRAFT_864369 [Dendrothele bispora CBS 962.96]
MRKDKRSIWMQGVQVPFENRRRGTRVYGYGAARNTRRTPAAYSSTGGSQMNRDTSTAMPPIDVICMRLLGGVRCMMSGMGTIVVTGEEDVLRGELGSPVWGSESARTK